MTYFLTQIPQKDAVATEEEKKREDYMMLWNDTESKDLQTRDTKNYKQQTAGTSTR